MRPRDLILFIVIILGLGLAMAAGSADAVTDAGVAALASSPVSPDDSAVAESTSSALAGDVYGALKGGQWLVAFGLALLVLVRVTRDSAAKLLPWLGSRWGGYSYAAGWALAMTIGTTLAAGEGFSWALVMAAAGAAWTAVGQHSTAQDAVRGQ